MPFKTFLAAVLALATVFSAASQIKVTGVGSAPKRSMEVRRPGGESSKNYKKIDDGAYDCLFLYRVKAHDKAGEEVIEDYYCMLDLGRNAARFTDWTVFRGDSAIFAPTPSPELKGKYLKQLGSQTYRFYPDIIQNYPEGNITYTDLVTPDWLEYTEPLGTMEWTITQDTDSVCGYLCTRAITSYGGRDWEAWFAEDIPSQFGPWKFNGLPGLILRARDTEGVHDFMAISFRRGATPVAKPDNTMIQTTTRDKFIPSKARFEKDPYKSIPVEAIQEVTVIGNQVIINGVETPRRPNGYTPVELE